jgi:hypothetical protein
MILYEMQQRNEEIMFAKIFAVNKVATLHKSLEIGPGNNKICVQSHEI